MNSGRDWLRIVRITDGYIELAVGKLSVINIVPRAALVDSEAAAEQRRLRPEVQQAEMYGPYYLEIGRLLCKA